MRADGESSLFLGAQSAYTTDPSFYYPKEHTLPALMPCFRLMDDEGVAVPGATLPELLLVLLLRMPGLAERRGREGGWMVCVRARERMCVCVCVCVCV